MAAVCSGLGEATVRAEGEAGFGWLILPAQISEPQVQGYR